MNDNIFSELQSQTKERLLFDNESFSDIVQDLTSHGYSITGLINNESTLPILEAVKGEVKFIVKCIQVQSSSIILLKLELIKSLKASQYINHFIDGIFSTSGRYFYYITEKLSCSMEQIMKQRMNIDKKLPFNQVIGLAIQITKAICSLQRKKVVHLFINPSNILYNSTTKCFCLSGYGFLSPDFSNDAKQQSYMNGQYSRYLAPEIFKNQHKISNKADVYSLGIILLELTKGFFLDNERYSNISSQFSIVEDIFNEDKLLQEINEIIQQMLIVESKNRINPSTLLKKLEYLKQLQQQQHKEYLEDKVSESALKVLRVVYDSTFESIDIDTKLTSDNIVKITLNEDFFNKKTITTSILKSMRQSKFKKEYDTHKKSTSKPDLSSNLEPNNFFKVVPSSPSPEVQFEQSNSISFFKKTNSLQLQKLSRVSTLPSNLKQAWPLKSSASTNNCLLSPPFLPQKKKSSQKQKENWDINWSFISKKYLIEKDKLKLIQQELENQKDSYMERKEIKIECENCQLQNNGLAVMSEALSYCTLLSTLIFNFQMNQITDDSMYKLSTSLNQCAFLSNLTLFFDRNSISDNGLSQLSSTLLSSWYGTNLVLGFSCNLIKDSGISSLANALSQMSNLSSMGLYFDHNQITDTGILHLSNAITACQQLGSIRLQFDYNPISNSNSLLQLGQNLSKLSLIYYLKLSFLENNFKLKDRILNHFENLFGKLKHNYTIYL